MIDLENELVQVSSSFARSDCGSDAIACTADSEPARGERGKGGRDGAQSLGHVGAWGAVTGRYRVTGGRTIREKFSFPLLISV